MFLVVRKDRSVSSDLVNWNISLNGLSPISGLQHLGSSIIMTCLVALLPSALAFSLKDLSWICFGPSSTFPGVSFEALQIWLPPTFLPSLLLPFHDTLHDRGDLSIWLKILSKPLVVFRYSSPCEASSQAHLAPGYFSAICLGSVLWALCSSGFQFKCKLLRMVFSLYRVQIKMPAANDTTPPFKEMPKILTRPDRPDL